MSMTEHVLDIFENATAEWFERTLGEPTPVQREAWPMIAAGEHVLVSAPTGTGKTLSAFLVFLDQMKRQARQGTLKPMNPSRPTTTTMQTTRSRIERGVRRL